MNRILLELVLALTSLTFAVPRIPAVTDWVAGYDSNQEAGEQKTYSAYVRELPRVRQWLRFMQAYGHLTTGSRATLQDRTAIPTQHNVRP